MRLKWSQQTWNGLFEAYFRNFVKVGICSSYSLFPFDTCLPAVAPLIPQRNMPVEGGDVEAEIIFDGCVDNAAQSILGNECEHCIG
jgi:hypothetical protein